MNYNSFLIPIAIGLAGFVGTLFRYGLSLAYQKYSLTLPIGTLFANIAGCFIIGFISAIAEQGEILSPEMRIILATGFCGGFTTMSSMIYETTQFLRDGELF
ncbi:MAG TPA: CrcB family protein, partial [Victivallales bacterium]|nr:CrcB family protein [Victivallales bacterium]